MKALVFLCQKSIIIREQNAQRGRDDEDIQVEQAIYEEETLCEDLLSDDEEDEDYDCEEVEDGLYDSKLDTIDEVLFFREAICHLEKSNLQMHNFLMSALDANEQAILTTAINKAVEDAA